MLTRILGGCKRRLLSWQRDGKERMAFYQRVQHAYWKAMHLRSASARNKRLDQLDRQVDRTLTRRGWDHPAYPRLLQEAQRVGLDAHQLVRDRLLLACVCPPVFGWQVNALRSTLYPPRTSIALPVEARTGYFWWDGVTLRCVRPHQLQSLLARRQPVAEQAVRAAQEALLFFRDTLPIWAKERELVTALSEALGETLFTIEERLTFVRSLASKEYPDASQLLYRRVLQFLDRVFPSPLYMQGGLSNDVCIPFA
jgi:hypothetical protein